ncbi:MAG TPA: DUF4197 domain-containing protein [Saprospiraceae bacterium]|jgi:hypothetical protein|nr:DUF4197 domain-containing protein [Saprospiraceae bacterium]HRO07327.1 DUF4197 domain-containing protein [Saprospiraceae bacterium]HRP40610.1 DUF4197 domain-containing protein [Saprospiraceae bacterium]
MTNRIWIVCVLIMFVADSSKAQIKDLLNKAKNSAAVLSGEESKVSAGLKEALNHGISTAVDQLSAKNGYLESSYKILIPKDAQLIIDKVKRVPGFEDVETKLIHQMNQAAEIAAKKATPIFVDAIQKMSFKDAKQILSGPDDAATIYLQTTSRKPLYDTFLPVIQSSLDEVNARTYWKSVVHAYNKIPLVKKLNPELDDHVNNKALDGLFGLIAVKEKGIRNDASQRTTELLKSVFGK